MAYNIYVIRHYRCNATLSLMHTCSHSTVWLSTVILSLARRLSVTVVADSTLCIL